MLLSAFDPVGVGMIGVAGGKLVPVAVGEGGARDGNRVAVP